MISTRKARNKIGRGPGYGGCHRCGDTWDWAVHHATPYGDGGRACFPLCETCWGSLSVEDRLPFYTELIQGWLAQAPEYEHAKNIINEWPKIVQAVMEGK